MKTEEMICELRKLEEIHKNDFVGTCETNWSLMCRDVANRLEELLATQKPRVMTIQEIKNANFCYLEVNGHDGVTPVLLKHFIDDKYIHVTVNGGSVYFFDITCDVGKLVRCWTSRPDEKMKEETPWDAQGQRDYESAIEMAEYCERYEPTYNADDGSM